MIINFSLFKNIFYNYLGPYSSILISLIFTPKLISLLGFEIWSVIGATFLFQTLIYLFLLGDNNYISKISINILLKNQYCHSAFQRIKISEKKNFLKFLFSLILFYFFYFLIFPNDKNLFNSKALLFSLIVSCRLIEIFYLSFFQGIKKFKFIAISLIIVSFFKWVLLIIILTYMKLGINFSLIWIAAVLLFQLTIYKLYFEKSINVNSKIQNQSQLEKKDHNIVVFIIFFILLQQLDKIIPFTGLDEASLSNFSLAIMIVSAIPVISIPLLNFFLPFQNEYEAHNLEYKNNFLFNKILSTLVLLTAFLIITYYFAGNLFLKVWIGSQTNINELKSFINATILGFSMISIITAIQNFLISKNLITIAKHSITICSAFAIMLTIFLIQNFINIFQFLWGWSILLAIFSLLLIINVKFKLKSL